MRREDVLEDIKNIAFDLYKKTKVIEGQEFNLIYMNKNSFFDYYYALIQDDLEHWLSSLKNNIEISNLINQPDYAFIHSIAKTEYPEDYADQVGVKILLDPQDINRVRDLNKISFEYTYETIYISNFIEKESFDEEFCEHTNKNKLSNFFKDVPICSYQEKVEEIEEIIFEETNYLVKIALYSISNAVLTFYKNNNLKLS